MLVSATEASSSSVEHTLVDNTRGVLFYSVPHNGSSLADYSLRPTAAYLLYPSVEVRDLRAGLFIIILLLLLPFYGPHDSVQDYPGEPVPER